MGERLRRMTACEVEGLLLSRINSPYLVHPSLLTLTAVLHIVSCEANG
jgi:hypothetical protein